MNVVRIVFTLCLAMVAVEPQASWGHGTGDWHGLSSRQKGMRIVSAALARNGRTGGQCKEWVRTVISAVTARHVEVPPNSAVVTATWIEERSGHIRSLGASIASSRPGDIVQMIIRDRDGNSIGHTAIVGSNDGSQLLWLESNYGNDEKVTTGRSQSISSFERSVVRGQYTVYRIS